MPPAQCIPQTPKSAKRNRTAILLYRGRVNQVARNDVDRVGDFGVERAQLFFLHIRNGFRNKLSQCAQNRSPAVGRRKHDDRPDSFQLFRPITYNHLRQKALDHESPHAVAHQHYLAIGSIKVQKLPQIIAALLDRRNALRQAQLNNRGRIRVTEELEILHQRIGVFLDAGTEGFPALRATLKAMDKDHGRRHGRKSSALMCNEVLESMRPIWICCSRVL